MAFPRYRVLGFAPDADPTTPGALPVTVQCLPTPRGIGNGHSITFKANTLLNHASLGGCVVTQTTGTQRAFTGDQTDIQEITGFTVTIRSTAGFHATTTDAWSFAQFGDVTLAVNKQDTLQELNAGTDFAAVSGAPKASIVIAPSLPNAQFAMLFDYNDGTNNYQDGIFWSALGDYTGWTPSIATQCGNIRLTDLGGIFTAAIPYRDGVVAFKNRGMYLGQYVGGSTMWEWTRVSADVGCIGKNAVVEADDVLYFADAYGLWMYDGSFPRRMRGQLHNWWAAQAGQFAGNKPATNFIRATWDKPNHRLYFSYGGTQGNSSDYIVFNVLSQLWTWHGLIGTAPSGGGESVCELLDGTYATSTTGGRLVQPSTSGGAASAALIGMHTLGDAQNMTVLQSVRPEWFTSGAESSTTWAGLALKSGAQIKDAAADFTDTPTTTGVDGSGFLRGPNVTPTAARYITPEIGIAASTAWEFGTVTVEADKGGAY